MTKRDELSRNAWGAMKGATWAVFARLREEHERSPATPAQMGLLRVILDAEEPLTPREIAKRLDVTPATITGALNGLEEAGLVERQRVSEDRRVVHVKATAKGRAAAKKWRDSFRTHLDAFLAPLDDDELETLVALLGRLAPPIQGPPGGFGALLRRDGVGAPASRRTRR